MNGYVKVLVFAVLAVVVQHLGRLFYLMQSYDNAVLKHYPGKCQVVEGFSTKGSEDMTLLPSGNLIITSGLVGLVDVDYDQHLARGAMYVMDTNKDTRSVKKMELKGWPEESHFVPHGVHHWVHSNKSVSVFVVLHMPECVARFLYDGKTTLTLTKIYSNDNYFKSINSVFVTGEDSFYVDNMISTRFGEHFKSKMEFFLLFPAGSIAYVKGDNMKFVAEGMWLPNGLTGNDKFLYAATKGAVNVFTRHPDGSLSPYKVIQVGIGSVDNLKLDNEGNLWIGCQNIIGLALAHMEDRAIKCPSTVIRVKNPEGQADIQTVFVDDGSMIQCSTVAIYHNAKIYVGTIHDKMAVCDVHYLMD